MLLPRWRRRQQRDDQCCRHGIFPAAIGVGEAPAIAEVRGRDNEKLNYRQSGYQSVELGIYLVYSTRKHLATMVWVLINFMAERFGAVASGRYASSDLTISST
jgi:hypothetical protein